MDEEDGRPGPEAWQSGTAGVLTDALMESLSHTKDNHEFLAPGRSFVSAAAACVHVREFQIRLNQEKHNENVPGK